MLSNLKLIVVNCEASGVWLQWWGKEGHGKITLQTYLKRGGLQLLMYLLKRDLNALASQMVRCGFSPSAQHRVPNPRVHFQKCIDTSMRLHDPAMTMLMHGARPPHHRCCMSEPCPDGPYLARLASHAVNAMEAAATQCWLEVKAQPSCWSRVPVQTATFFDCHSVSRAKFNADVGISRMPTRKRSRLIVAALGTIST